MDSVVFPVTPEEEGEDEEEEEGEEEEEEDAKWWIALHALGLLHRRLEMAAHRCCWWWVLLPHPFAWAESCWTNPDHDPQTSLPRASFCYSTFGPREQAWVDLGDSVVLSVTLEEEEGEEEEEEEAATRWIALHALTLVHYRLGVAPRGSCTPSWVPLLHPFGSGERWTNLDHDPQSSVHRASFCYSTFGP